MSGRWRALGIRLVKFHAVGALGIVVQIAVLALLKSGFALDYLVATALAVEVAVLHNFVWHERFTWSDRRAGRRAAIGRLLRFNLTTGLISIAGNLALMRVLAGWLHVHYLVANLMAIASCSLLNFLASDLFVFVTRSRSASTSRIRSSTRSRDSRPI